MIVQEKENIDGYKEVKILRNNATKDDKKVIGKNVPPIKSLKLKEDILLNDPFHCLINQTEKEIRQEDNIKIIPSSDTVLRLKERLFLAANIKGLEGSAKLSSSETDKTVMMVHEEILEVNHQDNINFNEDIINEQNEININEDILNEPIASSPKHTKKDYEKSIILDQLPEGKEYVLDSWNVVKDICQDGEIQFEVSGRVSATSEAESLAFVEQIMANTGSSMNIESRKGDRVGPRALLYGSRKCVMNVYHHKSSKKHKRKELDRDCPAFLKFKFEKSIPFNRHDTPERRANKIKAADFPLWFHLSFVHNHQIHRQEHTRFGAVSQETKDEYISLFEQDLTPSAAFYAHQDNIKKRNPENYHILLGDRRICPDYFWPFKFHHKWITEKLGSYDGIDAYKNIEDFITNYNIKCQQEEILPVGENYATVQQTEQGQTVIIIVDPFMRRVHKMVPQAADIMIMDATSNLDRSSSKLFHLMCPAAPGHCHWQS